MTRHVTGIPWLTHEEHREMQARSAYMQRLFHIMNMQRCWNAIDETERMENARTYISFQIYNVWMTFYRVVTNTKAECGLSWGTLPTNGAFFWTAHNIHRFSSKPISFPQRCSDVMLLWNELTLGNSDFEAEAVARKEALDKDIDSKDNDFRAIANAIISIYTYALQSCRDELPPAPRFPSYAIKRRWVAKCRDISGADSMIDAYFSGVPLDMIVCD